MKVYIMLALLVSSNAMAYDFESEWAKFEKDFAKLRTTKAIENSGNLPLKSNLPEINTDIPSIQLVDPKSPLRLGRSLQDPVMRDKMIKLYNKPDTVVYSLTLD